MLFDISGSIIRPLQIFFSIVVLGGGLGIVAGAGGGAIYGLFVGLTFLYDIFAFRPIGSFEPWYQDLYLGMFMLLYPAILSAIFGAPLGLVVGLLGGVILGLLLVIFQAWFHVHGFRQTIFGLSFLYGFLAIIFVLREFVPNGLPRWTGDPRENPGLLDSLLFPFLPAVLAGLAAAIVSRQIMNWYQTQLHGVNRNV